MKSSKKISNNQIELDLKLDKDTTADVERACIKENMGIYLLLALNF